MVYFYCEASTQIGFGHLQRCILIAQYLRNELGQTTAFCETSAAIKEHLNYYGIKTFEAIEKLPPKQIIIFDVAHDINLSAPEKCCKLISHLHQLGHKIIFLDGVNNHRFNPKSNTIPIIELVVTPYLGAKYPPYIPAQQWLHGANFILVDPQLGNIETSFSQKIKSVLITMGGTDRCEMTSYVLCALKQYSHINFNVIIGPLFSTSLKENLLNLAKQHANIRLIDSPHSLLPYYQQSDMVICTTGITSYEILVAGLSSIQISCVESHIEHFSHVEFSNYIDYLGYYKDVSHKNIQKKFQELISTRSQHLNMKNQPSRIADSHGIKRLAIAIQEQLIGLV